MSQANLTPQEQQQLFALMQKSGAQPTSGGMSQNVPDMVAQQGTGNVDANGLSQLFGQGQQPQQAAPQLQQQPGDAMHPNDAIAKISQNMMGGPQLQRNSDGTLEAQLNSDNPIMKLFGMKKKVPVGNANYFDAINKAGASQYLPSNLAKMPDGTPYVDVDTATKALDARRILIGQGKEVYNTLEQLTSQGLNDDEARQLLAANPTGVTSKEVGTLLSKGRLAAMQSMAESKATVAGITKLAQLMKVGGFDSAQPAAELAVKSLASIQKAQAIVDQIVEAHGMADQRQRADLGAQLGVIAGNSSGPLTDERMKQFIPDSYKGKFKNFVELLTNEREPVDFTGFLPQFQDALVRERIANQGIADGAQQLGIKLLAQNNPQAANTINNIRATNPLVGTPPAAPTQPTMAPVAKPVAQPHFSSIDDVKAAYQAGKLTVAQAKALVQSFHKGK